MSFTETELPGIDLIELIEKIYESAVKLFLIDLGVKLGDNSQLPEETLCF